MTIDRAIDIMSGPVGDVDYNEYATAKRIVVAALREYRRKDKEHELQTEAPVSGADMVHR